MSETEVRLIHSKRVAREAALKALYAIEVGKVEVEVALEPESLAETFTKDAGEFIIRLVKGVLEVPLDEHFVPFFVEGWTIDRIAVTDRLALRLACHELWNEAETPPKVIVNEWVTIAKTYGSAESGKFVNGILAKVLPLSPKADWQPVLETLPAKPKKNTAKGTEAKTVKKKWVLKSEP